VRLGSQDGLGILKAVREAEPDLPVVMISGHADIRTALAAIRSGALDFLEKPLDQGRLEALLGSLSDRAGLRRRVSGLEDAWLEDHIAGKSSKPMSAALALAKRAAPSGLCVLVEGPSGSGKELFARYIHLCSARAGAPLVAMNCAAVPAELFESELFGYRKGSFTGAATDRDGFFQAASGGTLFLDEIGELPLALQAKLLRALEYGEVQRVGAAESEKVDVRVVAASNRGLKELVARGAFREDLYYRLAQIGVRLPSLEERQEDIPDLARHFLRSAGGAKDRDPGSGGRDFSSDAIEYLRSRAWKGNVRELKNLVERAAWLCESPVIGAAELAGLSGEADYRFSPSAPEELRVSPMTGPFSLGEWPMAELRQARLEFDRRYIRAVLDAHGGSVSHSAKVLGLLPNNLSRELRALGLRRKREEEKAS